jgi:hypothetical protein
MNRQLKALTSRLAVATAAISLGACQDLTVVNPNLPDRGRATQQPTAAESFVST